MVIGLILFGGEGKESGLILSCTCRKSKGVGKDRIILASIKGAHEFQKLILVLYFPKPLLLLFQNIIL